MVSELNEPIISSMSIELVDKKEYQQSLLDFLTVNHKRKILEFMHAELKFINGKY